MKRIIQIGIIFVSLGLMFSCGTTNVEKTDDEQSVSVPVLPDDTSTKIEEKDESDKGVKKDGDHNSESDNLVDEGKKVESEGEKVVEKSSEKKHTKKAKRGSARKYVHKEEAPEEIPVPVIPVFDDWKYMGFGGEVPKEVEEAVKSAPVDFIVDGFTVYDSESHTLILHTSGLNIDQAENKLEGSVSKVGEIAGFSFEDYEVAESGWVNLNLAFFAPKLQSEEEGSEIYQSLLELLEQTYIAYQIYRKK